MRSSSRPRRARGFTLVEVLVALAIVAVALAAAVRAAGVVAGTDAGLRMRAMAIAAAENRLAELRLAREFPAPGRIEVDCSHGGYVLRCEQVFRTSVNAGFREVTVRVREGGENGGVITSVGGLLSRLPRGARRGPGRRPRPARGLAWDLADDTTRPRQGLAAGRGTVRTRRSARGFTLIELLVAITLMAVLSLIAWRGLEGIVNLRERLAQDADETDRLMRMLGQLERDLALRAPDTVLAARVAPPVPPLPNPDGGGDRTVPQPETATRSGQPPALPRQSLPLAIGIQATQGPPGSARLEIVREDATQSGAWQRVAWWRENDVLYRAVGVPSRTYPLPPPEATVAVMDAVSSFVVRGWLDQTGWQTLPPPPGTTAPITGLDVTITRDAPARAATYRRVAVFR
ncbi:type II secretion system minor pseudopilin GspI [Verticiella alkaliphila]|uniref:type II secretion system minor pseudopilin GspI n=1 Tax=Verticiella alkaliphila TaxID=2779529 RepID=UPI00209B0481|nr:type II secretion system minor pseudopilin GspI [Verticiella sp. GG226]